MSTSRNYTVKDIQLIIASSVVVQNAVANKQFLQSRRSTWTDVFFQEMETKIDSVTQSYLGLDNARQLREASQKVFTIRDNSLKFLSQLKVQLSQDFKKQPVRRAELLSILGFTTYYEAANTHKDQEALIDLLFRYKTNLTAEIKLEIIQKGIAEATLDQIMLSANILKDSNVIQEFQKGNKKVVTAAGVKAFNEVYDSIISICIISRNLFKGNAAKQDLFSFKKITNAMNGQ